MQGRRVAVVAQHIDMTYALCAEFGVPRRASMLSSILSSSPLAHQSRLRAPAVHTLYVPLTTYHLPLSTCHYLAVHCLTTYHLPRATDLTCHLSPISLSTHHSSPITRHASITTQHASLTTYMYHVPRTTHCYRSSLTTHHSPRSDSCDGS